MSVVGTTEFLQLGPRNSKLIASPLLGRLQEQIAHSSEAEITRFAHSRALNGSLRLRRVRSRR